MQTNISQSDDLRAPIPETRELSLADMIQVLRENARLLILGSLLFGLAAWGIAMFLPSQYTAKTRFLPPQQQQSATSIMLQSLGTLGGLAGASAGLKNPTDQYLSFLRARVVQDGLVDKFELLKRYERTFREDARRQLEQRTKLSAGKDNIIELEFTDPDPQFAATVANAYVEELGTLLNRLSVTEARQRRSFFEAQLGAAKNGLIKAEQALAASGVSSSALNSSPAIALEGPARLRAQVTAQEVELASLRSFVTPKAPEYQRAQAELNALRAQLSKAEREQPASRAGGPEDYIARYREFKYQETLFEIFSRQFEIAKMDESRESSVIQVVDTAETPERRSFPRPRLIGAAAFLFGLLVLTAFVYLRRAYRSKSEGH